MKAQTEAWLEYASRDLRAGKLILEEEHLTTVAVFHAQQCVEKSFKAVLVEKGLRIPKIHDLIKLHTLVENHVKLDIDIDQLELLNEVYTDTRYPVNIGLLPIGKASITRAKEFYEFATTVYQQIKKQFEA